MSNYKQIKLKYVANLFNGNSIPDNLKNNYTEREIPYIPTKALDVTTGHINYENGLSVNKEDGFRIAPTGSTLMCIEGGNAGRKIGITDRPVAFVNKLCCFDGNKINKKLLYYCLQSKDFTDQFQLNMIGLIGGVNISSLNNLYITLNEDDEVQKRTVYRLDNKCLQIDALITNTQAQIEKLKTYKQSLITEIVTKGLDPNVPMKDSEVEWIEDIPKYWELTRIKNCFKLRKERNYEALENVNLLSLYTEKGVIQHDDLTETRGNRAVKADGYKIVCERDIVVNTMLCWMGAIGMSKYRGITSPVYDVYKPKDSVISEYFHYLFRTQRFNGECYRYGRGIMMMRWRTSSTEFRAIDIPFPPKEEQWAIVEYLNKKCEQIDCLISIKQAKIDKLNTYKKSLIYEYITGKKEVLQ